MAGRTTFLAAIAIAVAVAVMLPAAGQAAAARDLCAQTAYQSLCRQVIGRMINPRRATHQTIKAMETKTKTAIADAEKYKDGNTAVGVCYMTFNDALYNLKLARRSIKKRDTMSINIYLNSVVSDYGACVDAFIESGQVNFIQNAVDELRKMSTNCLSISTMIR